MYERVYSTVGLSGPPIEQKVFRCSISTVPLIVGGENAAAKEFPHMVSKKQIELCGKKIRIARGRTNGELHGILTIIHAGIDWI